MAVLLMKKDDLYILFRRMVIDVLPKVQVLIENHKLYWHYRDYPISVKLEDGKWPSTNYTYSFYSLYNDDYIDYSSALSYQKNEDKIWIEEVDGVKDSIDLIASDENLRSRLLINKHVDKDKISLCILLILGDLLDRYISKEKDTRFIEEKFEDVYQEVLNSYLLDVLEFDICIPILMLEFEDNSIQLSETVSIERMTPEFIRSKSIVGGYDTRSERLVLDCATHMFVVKGCYLKNTEWDTVGLLTDKNVYPQTQINKLFACLQIITGEKTGYAQIVVKPTNNWINRNCRGDVLGFIGAKAQEYPESFKQQGWTKEHIKVNSEKIGEVKLLFEHLIGVENSALDLAIDRLHRSELRDREDDTILDAIIGIELLLSDNDKGELTYKISSRMATITTLLENFPYRPAEVKKSVAQVYRYRSDIVHSRKPKPSTTTISINEKTEISSVELALYYLRYAIKALAYHPKYLKSSEIDNLMMERLEKI